jgi:small subunit ribosomal protein S18
MAFVSKRKYCYFKENGITGIDYKDVKLLRRFITEHRKLVRAIKRARNIALMPYANVAGD